MFVTTLPYILATELSDVIVTEQYFSYIVCLRGFCDYFKI